MLFSKSTLPLVWLIAVSASPLPGLEERAVDASRFTYYTLPTPGVGPCDQVEGHDGALWGQGILDDIIYRIDPKTGHIDEYPVPVTTPLSANPFMLPAPLQDLGDRTVLSCAIRKGCDGNLYAANGLRNQLLQINETTKEIKIFQEKPSNPLGNLQPFNDLYSSEDGIYSTATTSNTFSFFSFKTQKFTAYNVPTPLSLPLGVFVASNGIVYIAELTSNKILTFNPKTKKINEYPLPEVEAMPGVIRAERNGYVYFSLIVGNGIGRINMKTHKIELFHTSQLGLVGAEDTIDSKGGVWYSSFTYDGLARLDTNTLKFSYIPFPGTGNAAGLPGITGDLPPYVDVSVNYGPGDAIWFAGITNNMVVRYDISGLYS